MSPSRLAIRIAQRMARPENRLGGGGLGALTVPSAPPVSLDPPFKSAVRGESFTAKFGDIGRIRRTWTACGLSLPQARRTQTSRHRLVLNQQVFVTPSPRCLFFISALTCSVFFLETVLPGAIDSSQTRWLNEPAMKRPICCLHQFITANSHRPMYKNPSTLSHTSSAASELLFFILTLFLDSHANV